MTDTLVDLAALAGPRVIEVRDSPTVISLYRAATVAELFGSQERLYYIAGEWWVYEGFRTTTSEG